eukprot:SAG11_NODE_348_length_10402_cov_8.763467_5_plen_90_part_00
MSSKLEDMNFATARLLTSFALSYDFKFSITYGCLARLMEALALEPHDSLCAHFDFGLKIHSFLFEFLDMTTAISHVGDVHLCLALREFP